MLIAVVVLTFLCGAALSRDQSSLADNLIRLHIVANSDSEADQALKLKVRDRVLQDMDVLLKGVTDRQAAEALVAGSLDRLAGEAKDVVSSEGCRYNVSAKIAVEDFPTKDYGSFSLPAGKYRALRIVIGEGNGHNWWCVVFPPLCMSAATNDTEALKILTDDQLHLITQDQPEYVLKFKSIELLDKLRSWLGI